MTAFTVTDHAALRMAQRGMSMRDAELAALIGTGSMMDISCLLRTARR